MDAEVSIDDRLQALANSHRRLVLRELADRSGETLPVSALEAAVVPEIDRSTSQLQTRSEIVIRLRHVHLPTLEAAGLCEYDPDRGHVAYVPDEFVESLLAFIDERNRSNQIH